MKLIYALALVASPAAAQNLGQMQIAAGLGSLLASEEPCGLTFDQEAIGAYVAENVDPAAMGFAGDLALQTQYSGLQISDMNESGLTAHCAVIARTAEHYGFIDPSARSQ